MSTTLTIARHQPATLTRTTVHYPLPLRTRRPAFDRIVSHDRPLANLPDRVLIAEARKIITRFEELAITDPFGWDWPTMGVLEPLEVECFFDIRRELKNRYPSLYPV